MPRKRPGHTPIRRAQSPVVRNEQSDPEAAPEELTLSAHYSGPLPLPEHFARYDEALPGAAERILAMAETEGSQRRLRSLIETVAYAVAVVGAIAFAVFRLWRDDVLSVAILGAAGLLAIALRRGA